MKKLALTTSVALAMGLFIVASGAANAECKPGKTGKIAFMLKHQKAFRYLNADVPFFVKTASVWRFTWPIVRETPARVFRRTLLRLP